jgi:hypothetical protein
MHYAEFILMNLYLNKLYSQSFVDLSKRGINVTIDTLKSY